MIFGCWEDEEKTKKKSTEKWAVWLEGNQEIVLVKKTFQEGGSEQVEQLWLREVSNLSKSTQFIYNREEIRVQVASSRKCNPVVPVEQTAGTLEQEAPGCEIYSHVIHPPGPARSPVVPLHAVHS